jgi:hypothetical protein
MMKVRKAHFLLTRLRLLASIKPPRSGLLLGTLLLLISTLTCWPGNGHISWAEERTTPPSVKSHAGGTTLSLRFSIRPEGGAGEEAARRLQDLIAGNTWSHV